MPFGAAVGGFSYLTLQGLLNTPGVGPVLQVIHEYSLVGEKIQEVQLLGPQGNCREETRSAFEISISA